MSKFKVCLSEPHFDGQERRYLNEAMRSTWVSSGGPHIRKFEQEFEEYLNKSHAVATVNGTAALHVALLVAGVHPGDEVIVPALTFVATANAVIYCGAKPLLLDVDAQNWCLDPEKVREFLETQCERKNGVLQNRRTHNRIAAILPVDLLGHPADFAALDHLARKYQVPLVEDACQALGSRFKGKRVGTLGHLTCFSFNGNKIITTGSGGMVVTRNPTLASRVRHLTTQAKSEPHEYVHDQVGFNYRMSNLQAALGCGQMKQLPAFIKVKRLIANRYRKAFSEIPHLECMPELPWATSNQWLFTIRLRDAGLSPSERLTRYLRSRGIEARRLWRPLHLLPMYRRCEQGSVHNAEILYEECVSLPSSVGLTYSNQKRVIERVKQFVETL
jgi:perosamine synthetase